MKKSKPFFTGLCRVGVFRCVCYTIYQISPCLQYGKCQIVLREDILWANLFSGFLQLQSSTLSYIWLFGRPYETAFWQRNKGSIRIPSRIPLRTSLARIVGSNMKQMRRIARAVVIQNRKQRPKSGNARPVSCFSGFVFIPPGKPRRRPCRWRAARGRFHPAG